MEFSEIGPGQKIILALILYIVIPSMIALTLWECVHPYAAASVVILDIAVIVCSIVYKGDRVTIPKFLNPILWDFIFVSLPGIALALSWLGFTWR